LTKASISEQNIKINNAEKDKNILSYKTLNIKKELKYAEYTYKTQNRLAKNSKELKFTIKNKTLSKENQNLTKKCEDLENEKQNLAKKFEDLENEKQNLWRANQNISNELKKYKNTNTPKISIKGEEFSTKLNEIGLEKGQKIYYSLDNLAFQNFQKRNAENETYQKENNHQLINRDYRILATRKRFSKKSKTIKTKCGFPGCDGSGNSRNQDGNIKFISHSSIRFCPNAKRQKSYTLIDMDKVYEQNKPKLIDSLKNIEISNLKSTIEELKKELSKIKTESFSSQNENVGYLKKF
jgi:hypothetical protein